MTCRVDGYHIRGSDEFDGRRHAGRDAIRAAFVPQFRGDFDRIRFHEEDLFVDPAAGRALISWTCTLERDGKTRACVRRA